METQYDFFILRNLRQKRNLTLKELAARSGLSYPTVASIETNKVSPSLKTIDAIAGALQIPTGRLISLAGQSEVRIRKMEEIHATILKNSDINLKKVNVANYGNLKIFRATVKCGNVVNSMKLHDDCDCYEVCYCMSGSIEISILDRIHRLDTDDVILFDGSLNHEYTAISDSEYLTIHLPKEAISIELMFENTGV